MTKKSMIINCATYAHGKRVADINLEQISDALQVDGQFVWLGLKDPDEEILKQIKEEFGLHELAIEDAHRAHQRPKVEEYDNTYFIVLRTAHLQEELQRIEYGETHFFLGKNFIISIRHGESLGYSGVRARCEAAPKLLEKGTGFVLYALMDFIVDQFFPVLEFLDDEFEKLEDAVFNQTYKKETSSQIYQLKSKVLGVKRVLSPLVELCNRFTRFDFDYIHDDIQPYFRDIHDHTIRINEMIDNTKEQMATVLEASFSLVSINQNEISKRFAGWAAIISIPTMVAGIYGMNFINMPELHGQYSYPICLSLIATICIILYRVLRKSGWL